MARRHDVRRERLENLIGIIVAAILVGVLVICQRSIGWVQLGLMLASLFGLIGLLALYNRRYR